VPPADPLAELDRLRRPTGPWLHLLDAAPSDARQLGWMPGKDNAVGLAAQCARLDAVGARYLRLSGWDAQEPAARRRRAAGHSTRPGIRDRTMWTER